MSHEINRQRRRFFALAAGTLAAARFGVIGSASAQTRTKPIPAIKPGTNTSFGPLKQIDAGLLNVGYAEAGPGGGPVVILLHGWPYDIHSFVDVAPLLAQAGYRVIVPYLRGYGTTHFRSSDTMRSGQPSAVAVDIIALMDALGIEKATIAGFDWGARTANIMAVLWPERCKAMVSVSGYLIGEPGGRQGAAAAEGRACVVVPVLFRHRARPCRLREIPARFHKADLADRLAEMEFRRRHLRSQRSRLRQPGPCRDRDPQLPLASRYSPKAIRGMTSRTSGSLRRL